MHFDVPATLRPAAAALARARRLYESAPAVTIAERLSSGPGNLVVTRAHERAPDRIAYRIISSTAPGVAGTRAIVIGTRRWQRTGSTPWRLSRQAALHVPRAAWSGSARNAFFLPDGGLTFYDPDVRAWYRLRVDRSGRPTELAMTGAAHFMHHVYGPFDAPIVLRPPTAAASDFTSATSPSWCCSGSAARITERSRPAAAK